jgi:thiol-disulfide isomerase/thioredoxin
MSAPAHVSTRAVRPLRSLLAGAALLVACSALAAGVEAPGRQPAVPFGAAPARPTRAPPLRLRALDGEAVVLTPPPGRVVLVSFWATWCAPCREELPTLVALSRQLAARHPGRFELVLVSMDESPGAVRALLDATPLGGARVALDAPEQTALAAYYTAARGEEPPDDYQLPQAYVVGADGRLAGIVDGPRDWSGAPARAYLEALLGVSPGAPPPTADRRTSR